MLDGFFMVGFVKAISTFVAKLFDQLSSKSAGPINAIADAFALILAVYVFRTGKLSEEHLFSVAGLAIMFFIICFMGWIRVREIQSEEEKLKIRLGSQLFNSICREQIEKQRNGERG